MSTHSYIRKVLFIMCVFTSSAESSPVEGKSFNTAIELLTAFSGKSATEYEPHFLFHPDSRIVHVEIHAVATTSTTARYSGAYGAETQVNNILRIRTADGFEAVSGVDTYYEKEFSDRHLMELQDVIEDLLALQTLDPVEVGSLLAESKPDLSDEVRSSIDIVLWDLAARKAGRPLYELLGAKRESMEPYASLPFYESLPEYIDAVNEYAKLGYKAFKFHVWGDFEKDSTMVELVQQTFADSDFRFMIDLEGAFPLDEALALGRKMDEGKFIWLEAPMDDMLLGQYSVLRRKLGQSILPAGYNIYSADFIRQGIEQHSWDAGRFDVTVIGGVSTALELMIIANEAGLPIEIQSWGHSLGQAANLHLMLANEHTSYFEAPMPAQAFEFGMKNGILLKQGRVFAPNRPGLGIEVDWKNLDKADFYVRSE